jgi:hypothetical protein
MLTRHSYCVNPKVAVQVSKFRHFFYIKWRGEILTPSLGEIGLAVADEEDTPWLPPGGDRLAPVGAGPLNCLGRAKSLLRMWEGRARRVSAGAISASPRVSATHDRGECSFFPLANIGRCPAAPAVGAFSFCPRDNFGHARRERGSWYALCSERWTRLGRSRDFVGCSW